MIILTKQEDLSQRLSACSTCEHKKLVMLIPKCERCGCFIPAKARLQNEKCPIGKWERQENQ